MLKKKAKKAHFIGICGKGMSGLAMIYKEMGYKVTGSDEGFYDPVKSLLQKARIKFTEGHNADNIKDDVDEIIIGKHAKLSKEENKEVAHAFMSGKKILSMPESLGLISKGKENIVVAGSFGKSTTTALLTHCLISVKKDPSYFIGAVPKSWKQNAHIGKSKYFVMEGDEYPSANFDNRSKFLHMHPKNVILISAEHDHMNIFPTEESYIKPYKELMKLVPKNGLVVANTDGKNVKKVIKNLNSKVVTYGMSKNTDYYPANITYGKETKFEIHHKNKKVLDLSTTMLGKHNIENIVGVCAFLLSKKLIKKEELQKAIISFKGLEGRIDQKTKKSSVLVYEGFGSSYSKTKAIFETMTIHFPGKRIVTVFEPHTFSWRSREALPWYKDIFSTSDIVIVHKPPMHGARTHDQLNLEEIVKEIKKSKSNVFGINSSDEGIKILENNLRSDDILLLITSGDLGGMIEKSIKLAEAKFPN